MATETLELRCESLYFTPAVRVSPRKHKRVLVCSSEDRGLKGSTFLLSTTFSSQRFRITLSKRSTKPLNQRTSRPSPSSKSDETTHAYARTCRSPSIPSRYQPPHPPTPPPPTMCNYYLIYHSCHEPGCENIVSAVNNGELVIWTCKMAEKRLLGRPRKCNGIILDREQYTRRTSASTHRLCGDHGGETWVKTRPMTPEWSP